MCTSTSRPKTSLSVCSLKTLINILTLQFRTITKQCTTRQYYTELLQQQNDDFDHKAIKQEISVTSNRSAETSPFLILLQFRFLNRLP